VFTEVSGDMNISEIKELEIGTKIKYISEGISEIRTLQISPIYGLIAQSSYDNYMPLNEDTMNRHKYKIEKIN